MDAFAVLVFGGLAVVLLAFVAIGRWYPGSGADQVDWRQTRSYEDEARLESEDVGQMIEAQNERRRASGRPEITEEEVRADVEAAERWRKGLSERYQRESERRPPT